MKKVQGITRVINVREELFHRFRNYCDEQGYRYGIAAEKAIELWLKQEKERRDHAGETVGLKP